MVLDSGIVAYELAHNKYMEWLARDDSKRREWASAYETIETLLGLNGTPCRVDTDINGREYKVTVYIKNVQFGFSFTY